MTNMVDGDIAFNDSAFGIVSTWLTGRNTNNHARASTTINSIQDEECPPVKAQVQLYRPSSKVNSSQSNLGMTTNRNKILTEEEKNMKKKLLRKSGSYRAPREVDDQEDDDSETLDREEQELILYKQGISTLESKDIVTKTSTSRLQTSMDPATYRNVKKRKPSAHELVVEQAREEAARKKQKNLKAKLRLQRKKELSKQKTKSYTKMADSTQWIRAAQQWIEWDVNAGTKEIVQSYLHANDTTTLRSLFHSRLEFGTAGLRAAMGPGTTAINDLVVVQTAQGLCDYVLHFYGEKVAKDRGIAIGYDHRANKTLNSKRFAQLTAAVCLQKGIKVYMFQGFVATPLVPFCIEQHGCAAGVMVTASHNPKADNGYKVYWGNGCQIIPPHDAGIATAILNNLKPWTLYTNDMLDHLNDSPLVFDPTNELTSKYFMCARQHLCHFPEDNATTTFPIAYTAMHGVGHAFTSRSFEAFQLPPYIPVLPQLHPDPEFPTVTFPNPEEGKGALKLAMETAESNNCRLILANDPDADRLAVAEQDPVTKEWKIFTGNEIGVLLGHWAYTQYLRMHPNVDKSKLYFVASTVSSKMLQRIAQHEGLQFVETLTGFKWMGNQTDHLRQQGKVVLFSFEEAIGFCIGDVVKDKDGVMAAAVFAEMAIHLHRHHQQSVSQHLETLYRQYGYFITQNHYLYCHDPIVIERIFNRLRNHGAYWHTCGNYPIAHIRDLTTGYDSAQPDHEATLPTSASSQMITFTFVNGCVATLRTSGTEPKLKYYVELAGKIGQTHEQVASILSNQVREIVENMLQPTENQLKGPVE